MSLRLSGIIALLRARAPDGALPLIQARLSSLRSLRLRILLPQGEKGYLSGSLPVDLAPIADVEHAVLVRSDLRIETHTSFPGFIRSSGSISRLMRRMRSSTAGGLR